MPAKTKVNKNYQLITNKLIQLLERGVKPWARPWCATPFGNLVGKNEYRGCNPLLAQMDLMLYNYSSPYFISYNQAREKGWQVRKGSKATTLTYAGSFEIENPEGKKETKFHTRFYKVFNLDCVDDSNSELKIADLVEAQAPPTNPDNRIEKLEEFCQSHNVPISHGGDRACYSPAMDRIMLPEFSAFSSAENYYATLLHELAHSSGHKDRLNRDLTGSFGSTKYAREELVAEITAALVANNLKIQSELTLENHASYLKSWCQVLKDDDRAFFNALSQARAASDYLLEKQAGKTLELV